MTRRGASLVPSRKIRTALAAGRAARDAPGGGPRATDEIVESALAAAAAGGSRALQRPLAHVSFVNR